MYTPKNTKNHAFFKTFAAVALSALAGIACAGTVSFSGSLSSSDAKFNRPLAGTPPTSLSNVGTSVFFDALPFYVNTPGAYTAQITSAHLNNGNDDTFIALYSGSFNAASPLTNLLAADDDSGVDLLSKLTVTLNSGVQYLLVVTSFENNQRGSYAGSISGQGNATATMGPRGENPVPVPGTLALVPLALAALALTRRRSAA